MATSYPGALDSLPNPSPTDLVENADPALDHNAQHANANDAIEAIQAELGVNPSGASATVAEWREAQRKVVVNPAAVSMVTLPGIAPSSSTTTTYSSNQDYYFPFHCEQAITFNQITTEVTTAATAGNTVRLAIYTATPSWQPSTLVEDFGTALVDSLGVKTLAPSGGSRTLAPGRYLMAKNLSGTTGFRSVRGLFAGGLLNATLGANPLVNQLYNGLRTHAAFSTSPTLWNQRGSAAAGFEYTAFLRVTAVD